MSSGVLMQGLVGNLSRALGIREAHVLLPTTVLLAAIILCSLSPSAHQNPSRGLWLAVRILGGQAGSRSQVGGGPQGRGGVLGSPGRGCGGSWKACWGFYEPCALTPPGAPEPSSWHCSPCWGCGGPWGDLRGALGPMP